MKNECLQDSWLSAHTWGTFVSKTTDAWDTNSHIWRAPSSSPSPSLVWHFQPPSLSLLTSRCPEPTQWQQWRSCWLLIEVATADAVGGMVWQYWCMIIPKCGHTSKWWWKAVKGCQCAHKLWGWMRGKGKGIVCLCGCILAKQCTVKKNFPPPGYAWSDMLYPQDVTKLPQLVNKCTSVHESVRAGQPIVNIDFVASALPYTVLTIWKVHFPIGYVCKNISAAEIVLICITLTTLLQQLLLYLSFFKFCFCMYFYGLNSWYWFGAVVLYTCCQYLQFL